MVDLIKVIEELNIIPKNFLEIGSRDGIDAELFRTKFNINVNNIHIVEPNPKMFNLINDNYPGRNLYHQAISNFTGDAIFHQVDSNDMDHVGVSSLLDRDDGLYKILNTNKIKIPVIKAIDLMNIINEKIDVCKIDVEGNTYEVLESFSNKIRDIRIFHLETENNMFWKDQKLHDEVKELMNDYDFECVFEKPVWGGNQFDTIWINKNY